LGYKASKRSKTADSDCKHDYIYQSRAFFFSFYLVICAAVFLWCKTLIDFKISHIMIKNYSGHKNGKFDQSWKDESNKNEWEIESSHHKKGRSLSSSDDVWNFVTVNIERGINKAKELKEPAGELIDYAGEQIVNLEEPAT
jgi:hypothetical protein